MGDLTFARAPEAVPHEHPEPERKGGDFASRSLPAHLLRGLVGFGSFAAAVAFIPFFWPASLVLAPVGLLALRGCPMCWAIGLAQTLSRGRLRRDCVDGRCSLRVTDRDTA